MAAPPLHPNDESQEVYLSTRAAAKVIGLAEQTLRHRRITGDTPPYIKLGDSPGARVVYALSSLKKWIADHTVTSTAAATVAQAGR